jgi:AcrR family transcriptional regulator
MLLAATHLLSTRGFDGTSMRMVAERAHVRAASLYYHFPSKAEMMVAVYQESARQMSEYVQAAVGDETDPWRRLELGWAAHVRALLAGIDYVQVTFGESPRRFRGELRTRLIAERDRYESVLRGLIDALPIRNATRRKYFTLTLLGAGAWARTWYRPGGTDAPDTIAAQILAIVRSGIEGPDPAGARRRPPAARR